MICERCGVETNKPLKTWCRTCYFYLYEHSEKRVAYKKEYNAREDRKLYAKKYHKSENFRKVTAKYQSTEKFALQQRAYRVSDKGKWGMARRGAKRRGIEWSISLEDYINIIKPLCHYCAGPLSPFGINLDRKNNAIGYTKDNVVTCCGDCNRTKGDRLTYEEMVAVSNLLKEMRK